MQKIWRTVVVRSSNSPILLLKFVSWVPRSSLILRPFTLFFVRRVSSPHLRKKILDIEDLVCCSCTNKEKEREKIGGGGGNVLIGGGC